MWQKLDWDDRDKKFNEKGYVLVHFPEHPHNKDGWFLEHRLVMENYIGRYLDPDQDVVHHVNEIKNDNRIENLWLCDAEEHSRIHRMGSRHKNTTKAKVRKQRQTWKFERDSMGRFKKTSEKDSPSKN